MSAGDADCCCPPFDPEPWDEQQFTWENRRFVKDRVLSFLHIPLNFGAVMRRNLGAIEAAGAMPAQMLVLSDENSLWGADVYIEVTKDIAGAEMATISGRFLSKVFEGPYSHMRRWMQQMQSFVANRGEHLEKLYCFYTTCPNCARKYGRNYVVLLARV